MSEERTTNETPESNSSAATEPVKKGTLIIVAAIVISLLWYLTSDRYTPYTQQARIQGFVVGVAPKVGGVVTKVWVKNDETVELGQPLFEIDRDQYVIAVKRAKSDLENTRKQIAASAAGVASAKANLLATKANALKAEQDANRQERLYKEDKGSISVRRLEMSRASLEQAHAQVAVAKAEIQRAIEQKGGDGDDNAQLKSALSAVEKAELDLKNTVVKASSAGVITDLRADVGLYAGAGNPVITLIAIDSIWIIAQFTENNLGHMKVGTPVEIVVDAIPASIFTGTVRSIGLGVSSGQSQPAGTLPTIDNNRDWLRQSQRYPVTINFDAGQREQLKNFVRIGGQTEVIAYTEDATLLKLIGKIYIRIMSLFSYAY